MQAPLSTTAAKEAFKATARGIAAAQTCELYGITDPVTEIPLLALIAKTAREHLDAVRDLRRSEDAWRKFAAGNAYDDPAHEEHRQRTMAARTLVQSLDLQLGMALRDHSIATGAESIDEAETEGAGRGLPR